MFKGSINPPCPYCGGKLIKKGKHHRKQCYICKDCGKWCTGKNPKPTIHFKDINTNIHCPYCDTIDLATRGKDNKGRIVYLCLHCRRRFIESTAERLNKKYVIGEVCPRCGSTNLVHKGIGKTGNQRYKCKDCGRSYTKGVKLMVNGAKRKPPISEANKRLILMYKLNLGLSYPEIAEHFNCSQYAVQQLVKEYYAQKWRVLTYSEHITIREIM